jgi:hypothetical protein
VCVRHEDRERERERERMCLFLWEREEERDDCWGLEEYKIERKAEKISK